MNKTISLHEAATMLAKHNPDKGDYEFFKKEILNAIKKGELEAIYDCEEGCEDEHKRN